MCTFCALTRNPHDEDENVLHLFFQCRSTEPVVLGILAWFVNNDIEFERISRQNYFGTFNTDSISKNILMQLVCALVKKIHLGLQTTILPSRFGVRKRFLKGRNGPYHWSKHKNM
jgi:hypothetical protein